VLGCLGNEQEREVIGDDKACRHRDGEGDLTGWRAEPKYHSDEKQRGSFYT